MVAILLNFCWAKAQLLQAPNLIDGILEVNGGAHLREHWVSGISTNSGYLVRVIREEGFNSRSYAEFTSSCFCFFNVRPELGDWGFASETGAKGGVRGRLTEVLSGAAIDAGSGVGTGIEIDVCK
jgi:hypothetical protein